jgi:hypothetical protein
MADDLDDEIYPHNDDTVGCQPVVVRFNPTTGVKETIALTGRTDGIAFLSTTDDIDTAVPIHASLSIPLTEIGATATYAGVMEGSAKATHLAATADGATLWRHFQFGSDYRTRRAVTFRRSRP